MAPAQLALEVPQPAPATSTYWENRGPRDWQPVHVVVRYGNTQGAPHPALPHVRTKPSAPRNVCIERADGVRLVVPVRTLRRQNPNPTERPAP